MTLSSRAGSLALLACCVAVLATPALARSISSTISLGELERRCKAAGGEVIHRNGGTGCITAGGAAFVCYDMGDGTIGCDVLVERGHSRAQMNHIVQTPVTPGNGGARSGGGGSSGGNGCPGGVC